MKIVQLSSVHPSSDTRIFHKICKSLVNHGFEVDLIIQNPKNEMIDGISIKCLPIAKKKSDRITKILPQILKLVIQYPRKTIIHFHDSELIPCCLVFKLFGYRVIYDVHEDVPKDILAKEWIPKYLRIPLAFMVNQLEKVANKFFDATIVVTKHIGNRFKGAVLVQNYPLLTNNKVEVARVIKEQVFYVGSISLIRGIKEMILAMNLMNKGLKLVLAGNFINKDLEQDCKKLIGWEKVEFIGSINSDERNSLASKSLAGLVIFHPVPNHIDAQPNKLFEYMEQGLPVIGSDFPLWREIVNKNNCGILVNPESPKEIAEAIQWLLDHPEEAKKMGENGHKAVNEKYNWKLEESKLLDLIHRFV